MESVSELPQNEEERDGNSEPVQNNSENGNRNLLIPGSNVAKLNWVGSHVTLSRSVIYAFEHFERFRQEKRVNQGHKHDKTVDKVVVVEKEIASPSVSAREDLFHYFENGEHNKENDSHDEGNRKQNPPFLPISSSESTFRCKNFDVEVQKRERAVYTLKGIRPTKVKGSGKRKHLQEIKANGDGSTLEVSRYGLEQPEAEDDRNEDRKHDPPSWSSGTSSTTLVQAIIFRRNTSSASISGVTLSTGAVFTSQTCVGRNASNKDRRINSGLPISSLSSGDSTSSSARGTNGTCTTLCSVRTEMTGNTLALQQ